MKALFLSFCLLLTFSFSSNLIAQMSGTVAYVETVSTNIPDEVRALRPNLPTENENERLLQFIGKETNYIVDPNKKEDPRNNRRRFFMNRVDPIIYYNHELKEKKTKQDGFGKEFIIEEGLEDRKWKIVPTEQRDIKGYTCMKAILVDTTLTEVWFTPQIPISYGPAEFFGLPGLILAVSVGEDRVILAQNIDLEAKIDKLKPPKGGKKVSLAEYEEIIEKKQKEMEEVWGNGNRRRYGAR